MTVGKLKAIVYLFNVDLSILDEENGISVLFRLLDIVVGSHAGLRQFHARHRHLGDLGAGLALFNLIYTAHLASDKSVDLLKQIKKLIMNMQGYGR